MKYSPAGAEILHSNGDRWNEFFYYFVPVLTTSHCEKRSDEAIYNYSSAPAGTISPAVLNSAFAVALVKSSPVGKKVQLVASINLKILFITRVSSYDCIAYFNNKHLPVTSVRLFSLNL